MKKIIFVIITTILLFSMSTGCQKDASPTIKPVKAVDPLEKQKAALHEIIEKGNYTLADNRDTIGSEWIKMWLDNIYSDYGLSDICIL